MKIAGIRNFSLVDYPGMPCAVAFTKGCNLRCPWCHNWKIAYGDSDEVVNENLTERLFTIKKHVDAICITGGEPTIYQDLFEFCQNLKSMGYLVKVDSNGTNPKMIKRLVEIVDYFAIDVKARPEGYYRLTGNGNIWKEVRESIEIIRESKVNHELRMTYVGGLSEMEDIEFLEEFSIDQEKVFLTFAKDTEIFKNSKDFPKVLSKKIKVR